MSKYEPLAQFLEKHLQPVWQAKFADVERILGFSLPKSAYQYPAWWANQGSNGHSQTAGWRDAGWRTANIDLGEKRVTFERSPHAPRKRPDSLVERALIVSGSDTRGSVIERALTSFAVDEAYQYLNAIGGSMPAFKPAPREQIGR